jgi:hypothetical protein
MPSPRSIDPDLANTHFHYNPETGHLSWKVRQGVRGVPGSRAGCRSRQGYIRVKLDGRLVMAHRLAWVIHYGVDLPANAQIDHKNGNRADNRIDNLRLATGTQNRVNTRLSARNSTGFRGVYPLRGRFAARIKGPDGQRYYLGAFDTPEEAHLSYMSRARELYGEFATNGVA